MPFRYVPFSGDIPIYEARNSLGQKIVYLNPMTEVLTIVESTDQERDDIAMFLSVRVLGDILEAAKKGAEA